VFTNGVFDLVHPGHVAVLEAARGLGAALVVGLNSDSSVRGLGKGSDRPLVPEAARARVIAAIGAVDCVILFAQPTPLELILALQPDIIVKGGDYQAESVVGGAEASAWGGRVVIVPLVPELSTTSLLERLRAPS
jgi:D-beta-D-heptose 7-phosphate kinase/D-beta-D-heptose 1-phosphate adenosyltransferase